MGPARLSHVVYKVSDREYRGISVVLTRSYTSNMSNAILPMHLQYSQLVVRWYTVTAYDLYKTPRSTTYRRTAT